MDYKEFGLKLHYKAKVGTARVKAYDTTGGSYRRRFKSIPIKSSVYKGNVTTKIYQSINIPYKHINVI